jgi:hypothetical protein
VASLAGGASCPSVATRREGTHEDSTQGARLELREGPQAARRIYGLRRRDGPSSAAGCALLAMGLSGADGDAGCGLAAWAGAFRVERTGDGGARRCGHGPRAVFGDGDRPDIGADDVEGSKTPRGFRGGGLPSCTTGPARSRPPRHSMRVPAVRHPTEGAQEGRGATRAIGESVATLSAEALTARSPRAGAVSDRGSYRSSHTSCIRLPLWSDTWGTTPRTRGHSTM